MSRSKDNGGLATLVAGQIQYWRYSNGLDVGIATAAPNLKDVNSLIELVAQGQGVTESTGGDGLVYTVRIEAIGAGDMSYNLNIEDWE